jgi:gamma-glutamyltranspeptidase
VQAIVVEGARHGGDVFYTGEPAERVIAFLRQTIGP